jgi:hypothetical protein
MNGSPSDRYMLSLRLPGVEIYSTFLCKIEPVSRGIELFESVRRVFF